MLAFLVISGFSRLDNSYSLNPPFQQTEIGEIGNWSLVGTSVSRKRMLYLTSGLNNTSGGICSRVPTLTENWLLDTELQTSDDTVVFAFSRNVCPQLEKKTWSGVNISFEPGDHNMSVRIRGDGVFGAKGCAIEGKFSRIRIKKEQTNFTVTVLMPDMTEKTCFNQQTGDLNTYGYLSLWAISGKSCKKCSTEIKGINFFALSPDTNIIDAKLSAKNRKQISDSKGDRQFQKMVRRAKMLTVAKYVEEMRTNDDLEQSPNVELKDALIEAREMIHRAQDCISAENLSIFIKTKMIPTIDKAAARFERVTDALWHMKNEMINLWDDAQNQLKVMNGDVKASCVLIEHEVLEAAQQIQGKVKPINQMPKTASGLLDRVLFVTCIAEFACYVTFFVRYHRKNLRRKRM